MPSGTTPGGKSPKAGATKSAATPEAAKKATRSQGDAVPDAADAPTPTATAAAAPPAGATNAAEPGGAPKKTHTPLAKKDVAYFEKRLIEERKRVLKELGHHGETFGASQQESDGDLSSYSFHMADQGTDAMEREKAFLFASQEGRFLWHIDEALRRLYRAPDAFGRCHSCGGSIAFERLDALPHARYCIDCKQREEEGKRGGGG